MTSAVRPLLVPLFLVIASASLHAQQQDRKLEERIMKPNMEMSFDLRQASGRTQRSFGTKDANTGSFFFRQKVSPGAYNSKDYSGTKTAWTGDFRFGTKEARTKGNYVVPNATKQVNTKATPVKDARETSKDMATRDYPSQREFRGRGRSQDRFDSEGGVPKSNIPVGWQGNELKEMTIDDIRELLNKSK